MVFNLSQWRDHIEQQGFAVIQGVLRRSEVRTLRLDLSDLYRRPSRAGIRHILSHSAINSVANDARVLGIAQSILGENAFPFRATLFNKSPDSNWLIAWHQDTALPLIEKHETPGWGPWSVKEGIVYAHAPAGALEQVLALRLHLDDCTADNGPLRVLAVTDRLGVLSDKDVERQVGKRKSIECPIARGGVLVMRPLLIHASSKSLSALPRRVLHIEYAASVRVGDGLQLAMA